MAINTYKATIVMFYGEKEQPLTSLIESLQGMASKVLGPRFSIRPVREVHATLVGLERTIGDIAVIPKQIGKLTDYLEHNFKHSKTIQFGGIEDKNYTFRSQGATLYEREIGVVGNKLVLIGWPIDQTTNQPNMSLDIIRRECQDYGIRHKYHDKPEATDPDCYMVLGKISGLAPGNLIRELLRQAHALLHEKPVRARVGIAQLGIAEYEDSTLPYGSTRIIKLD